VKWFKKDEPRRKEAEILFQRIKDFESEFIVSEWILLEVTRGLVKAGVKKDKVEEINRILNDLLAVGAIKAIPVTQVLNLATDIEIEVELYAADAVHLATAITTNSKILWTEDEHLHKNKVKEYAKKHKLEILTLEKK
jgi:predicted nucleic acid-binding protein